ncbi:nitrate reductase delta subunit [Geobacter sp. OR-1]|uniref:nitrate reductase molybdenum cofactor assembly chaperone n=1 Tax=Geobacter sp. OR-1 TaxID=1266765 RepID=UPI0005440991|nr:nitrate reductase molybdenum cofactor assembly chaperone [Geobacter sp. OR-1]GAM09938.1 nitrate reductase delta subunit [Geobacter sp. OR-1]
MQKNRLYADILDYPAPVLVERLEELLPLIARAHGQATQLLQQFREFVVGNPLEKLEEIYTVTFDLQPLCSPYIGYQLFGEEYRRGMFMARLREHYRSNGFAAGDDLPDHLCVILRFLASREPGEVEGELITDCMIPALGKMLEGFTKSTNPYREALQSLLLLMGDYPGSNTSESEED